jgi:hypothetical protein
LSAFQPIYFQFSAKLSGTGGTRICIEDASVTFATTGFTPLFLIQLLLMFRRSEPNGSRRVTHIVGRRLLHF